jgi:hypothetical protein
MTQCRVAIGRIAWLVPTIHRVRSQWRVEARAAEAVRAALAQPVIGVAMIISCATNRSDGCTESRRPHRRR